MEAIAMTENNLSTRGEAIRVAGVVAALMLGFWLGTGNYSAEPKQECDVRISDPDRDGREVGRGALVKGTASVPGGNHLWVLVRATPGYEEVWWPQNEGKTDPRSGQWEVYVTFGERRDIGHDFEIAAIVVNEREHAVLKDWRKNAMRTGEYRPIEMPPTTCAPIIRRVRKVSDD
jgi:hypothetical protein